MANFINKIQVQCSNYDLVGGAIEAAFANIAKAEEVAW